MSGRRKLIVVSNRGPLAFARDADGERVARRGAGGLVTALAPLVAHHDVTWIASALSDEDRAVAAEGAVEETARDGSRYRLRLVAHRPSAYDLYYNVVANPALWFVQHGLWELKHDPDDDLARAWEEGYVAVNQAFADAVLEELEREPGATVFFHDYHLYVAPALVRAQRPDGVARPLHAHPLGGRRGLVGAAGSDRDRDPHRTARQRRRRLPHRALAERVSLGLLEPGPRHGRRARRRRIRSRSIRTSSRASRESDAVLERERELVASRPETMILRVDRTDPSKNVVRGLEAFGLLLERRPDLRGRVGMVALLDPSRQEIPEYVEELHRIEAAAAALEERFPGALQLRVADDFPSSIAAYKQFDVLLVNAVMDGLNLVAKEAPLVNTRDGVVVLSVNTGAHEELGRWTVPVDPLDVEGQATALEEAIALLRSRAPGAAGGDPRARAHATTWSSGSTPSWPTSTARVRCGGDERPLARRRVRLRAHGRRRRQADVAASGGRARLGADGGRDGAAPRLAAEGRRARDRAARRDHGREADERPDPALPPAAAVRRRGLARGGRRRRRDHRRRRDDRADGGRDGGARRRFGRRADGLRHGEGDRQGDGHRRGHARREDEGGPA